MELLFFLFLFIILSFSTFYLFSFVSIQRIFQKVGDELLIFFIWECGIFFKQLNSVFFYFLGDSILSTYVVKYFFFWLLAFFKILFLSLIGLSYIRDMLEWAVLFTYQIRTWIEKRKMGTYSVIFDISVFYLLVFSLLRKDF